MLCFGPYLGSMAVTGRIESFILLKFWKEETETFYFQHEFNDTIVFYIIQFQKL